MNNNFHKAEAGEYLPFEGYGQNTNSATSFDISLSKKVLKIWNFKTKIMRQSMTQYTACALLHAPITSDPLTLPSLLVNSVVTHRWSMRTHNCAPQDTSLTLSPVIRNILKIMSETTPAGVPEGGWRVRSAGQDSRGENAFPASHQFSL